MGFKELAEAEEKIKRLTYAEERGFVVRYRAPNLSDPYPYLVFKEPRQEIEGVDVPHVIDNMIVYVLSKSEVKTLPIEFDFDWFVNETEGCRIHYLAELVGSCRDMDGDVFTTVPGNPINIFLSSFDGRPTAHILETLYPAKDD